MSALAADMRRSSVSDERNWETSSELGCCP
jgi:hypothetical protein